MSTRSQIGFYKNKEQSFDEPDVLIYKHSDGYPEGVIPLLKEFCKMFKERRGLDDTEYAGAWYVYELINEHVNHMKEFKKETNYTNIPDDGMDCLSHGIVKGFQWDIDFYYRVHPNEIKVYEMPERKLVDTIVI
jgi:hypothetical protein